MRSLIIEATEDTPLVYFNPSEGKFIMEKSSLPENAVEYYSPVLEWLKEYQQTPNPKTVFDFSLDYLNTASSKQIFEVIMMINKISAVSDVTLRWHYDSIDEDMLGLGKRFSHLVNIKFEFIEYENEDDFEI
jgi:hypothetical protein